MSTLRQHPIWKRTAAVGVAIGLSAGAIGVAVGAGGSDGSPATTQTGLVQPSFAGQATGATPPSGGAMQAPPAGMGPDLAAAATALGSTESAVQRGLSSGTTIAAQAEAAGVDLDTVVAAMVTAETASLQERVTAGTMTQDQADQIISGISERVTSFVNGQMPSGPPPGAPAAPTAAATQG